MQSLLPKVLIVACSLFWGQALIGNTNEPTISEASEDDVAELSFLHTDGLNWHAVDLSTDLVYIKPVIENEEVWAILDNGSDSTYIDEKLVRSLGGTTTATGKQIQTPFGSFEALRTSRMSVTIPGQFQVNARFGATDLSSISNATGKKIGMVLGSDIIDRFSYLIDFVKGRMLFVPSGSMNFSDIPNQTLPISDRGFAGIVNGVPARLEVDLGSNNALIMKDGQWSKFFGEDRTVDLGKRVDTVGNVVQAEGVEGVAWSIATLSFRSDVKKGQMLKENIDGYIGTPFFRDKAAYFDYPGGRILVFTEQ